MILQLEHYKRCTPLGHMSSDRNALWGQRGLGHCHSGIGRPGWEPLVNILTGEHLVVHPRREAPSASLQARGTCLAVRTRLPLWSCNTPTTLVLFLVPNSSFFRTFVLLCIYSVAICFVLEHSSGGAACYAAPWGLPLLF